MVWTRRGLLTAGTCAMVVGARAAAADAYPLWEVSAGGARVFLFGDCGSPVEPWRSQRVLDAFDASAVFWKETPDIGPADIAAFEARGTDHARPLASWLTPGQQARVTAAAGRLGITDDRLQFDQPWLAAAVLGAAAARQQAPSADPLSVLTARARQAGRPIRTEFADVGALIDWWVAIPAAAQVQYLMHTIDTIEADPAEWPRREAAWARGDLRLEAARVRQERRRYPLAYEAETGSRNRAWPARFRAMLAGGGTTFVLVGADHLVGPDSVLAALARAGTPPRRI